MNTKYFTMKNAILSSILSLFVWMSSCEKDPTPVGETAQFNLKFKTLFNGEPLIFNKAYTYQNTPFMVSKLQFYISNIELTEENDSPDKPEIVTEIGDVVLIDLEDVNSDSLSAIQGKTLTFENIPVGTYNGVGFGVGVYQELNRQIPSDFSSSHPLSSSGNYWENWNSYIFVKLEGRIDTNGDGEFNEGMLYHLGTDNLFSPISIKDGNIELVENGQATKSLVLELEKIFNNGDSSIDINTEFFTHTNPNEPGQLNLSTKFMTNFIDAISVE